MNILIMILLSSVSNTVNAQFGLIDYGGFDMFIRPGGFNEGPCIVRNQRKLYKKKESTRPTVQPFRKANNVKGTKTQINSPSTFDSLFGGFDFLFNIFSPAPFTHPVERKVKASKVTNQKPIKHKTDYSKLSNNELQRLLEMAAKQSGIRLKKESQTGMNSPFRDSPFYRDLSTKLQDVSNYRQLKKGLTKFGASSFRPLGAVPNGLIKRRRRSILRSKRQLPFDLNMGPGMHAAFCACLPPSEIEPDYIVQPPYKYRCNPGLMCVCSSGGVV